jgi:hypothetical protein
MGHTLLSFSVLTSFYLLIVFVEVIVAPGHIQWHTLGSTPLDGRSAHRRELYLTKHNTHKRQTSMSPDRFEPAVPASERPQT